MKPRSMIIIDGYTDEPGGLGVPPYIDVYPRYIAGATWLANPQARIDYYTIDEVRRWDRKNLLLKISKYDVFTVIAGVVVPGKYIGARPIQPEELIELARIEGKNTQIKVLAGAAAKWGLGWKGGTPAYPPSKFYKAGFHALITGDVEEYFYTLFLEGEEKANPRLHRKNYDLVNKAAPLGAAIIRQHPNYARNLVVEIETYRGCSRWITGGCSFCVEPLRGKPLMRSVDGIIKEVEALYRMGARHYRLGRQADILVYGSKELGEKEWPRPSPEKLKELFYGIRSVAGDIETLHIDNMNPGTIARYPEEAREALKIIVEYHTPGDVAALGLETADPKVARINNLNTTPEEALEAIRIINDIGKERGWNGMPHLLPGINFILGLPGESKETYRLNKLFLNKILNNKFLIRRVNVRKLMAIPATRVYRMKHGVHPRREKHARSFIYYVRNVFEKEMLKRIAPPGTRLKRLWIEACENTLCYARQPGSYPLMTVLKNRELTPSMFLDEVEVIGIRSGRSVLARLTHHLYGGV